MAEMKASDEDIDNAVFGDRFSRNECVLRFMSLVCLCFMFGLFIIQMEILWRSRESILMEMFYKDVPPVFIKYPDYFKIPHNEDTWTWDPDTLLLKVNTSIFIR
ncbi:hypothetical protein ACF0H5_022562 [Mactra antiquata]